MEDLITRYGLVAVFVGAAIDWGTTPHPAGSAASGCTLVELRAEHPEPDVIRPLLAALHVELPLSRGAAALIATIDTPSGRLQLT